MRRLCLSGFRLVAPPFAVHDAHNQGERQQVATFIGIANNLAVFQQRVCCARSVSKIAWEIHRIWRNMSPFKKLSKRDDQLSSYGVVDVVDNVALPLSHWLENVFYRNIRQWASNGHLVTVEANRHRLPNLLSNCGKHRQEVTYTSWLINDDDVLTASTVTLTVTLPVTGTGQTGSPLAEPDVEEETDRCKKLQKHYGACYVYLITW